MIQSIPIPTHKSQYLDDGDNGYITLRSHLYSDNIDNVIIIHPGPTSTTKGAITIVNVDRNSYRTLYTLIGKHPISTLFSYTPQRENLEELEFPWTQEHNNINDEKNNVCNYIVYYDVDTQRHQLDNEYNYTISKFTNREFWGHILLVDLDPNSRVIKHLIQEELYNL